MERDPAKKPTKCTNFIRCVSLLTQYQDLPFCMACKCPGQLLRANECPILTDTNNKIRNFYSFFFRYLFDRRPIPRNVSLFQPTIWTSSTPLGDLDIMGHKSNSTYLSDLDVARSYHLCSLFRAWSKQGLTIINPQKKENSAKPFYPVVGAVSCTFRKPIWPLQKYDIVTRLLSWDGKWMYLISHFVKKDAFKPRFFSDQPTRNTVNITHDTHDELLRKENGGDSGSSILAMSVTKIVFKEARNTIPPAQFLRDCGYLSSGNENAKPFCMETQDKGCLKTTIEQIEERRLRGLRVAEKLNILDEGSSFFDCEEQIAYSKF